MIRLLLETATDVCSVAISRGGSLLAQRTAQEAHQHSSHLTLFIAEVLRTSGARMNEVEEIVLSDGPGSYTSLRVGAATAKGLCVALPGLRLVVVPTLAALAFSAVSRFDVPVLATINSRRGEVYGQLFGSLALPRVQSEEAEEPGMGLSVSPQNIRLTQEGWWETVVAAAGGVTPVLVGPGQRRLETALLPNHLVTFAGPSVCSASLLLAPASAPQETKAYLGVREVDVASYEPLYVNPPFVTKSKKKPLG